MKERSNRMRDGEKRSAPVEPSAKREHLFRVVMAETYFVPYLVRARSKEDAIGRVRLAEAEEQTHEIRWAKDTDRFLYSVEKVGDDRQVVSGARGKLL
jgi:hypothetical protein